MHQEQGHRSRMQSEAEEVFDLSREPESTRRMYGDGVIGRQLLLTRRTRLKTHYSHTQRRMSQQRAHMLS